MRTIQREEHPADPDWLQNRVAAAHAVERIAGHGFADLFLPLLSNGDPEIRASAARFFTGSEDPGAGQWRDLAKVIAELGSNSAEECRDAARNAGELRDPRAVEALRQAMNRWRASGHGDTDDLVEAAAGMARVRETIEAIVQALRRIGGPEAEQALSERYKQSHLP